MRYTSNLTGVGADIAEDATSTSARVPAGRRFARGRPDDLLHFVDRLPMASSAERVPAVLDGPRVDTSRWYRIVRALVRQARRKLGSSRAPRLPLSTAKRLRRRRPAGQGASFLASATLSLTPMVCCWQSTFILTMFCPAAGTPQRALSRLRHVFADRFFTAENGSSTHSPTTGLGQSMLSNGRSGVKSQTLSCRAHLRLVWLVPTPHKRPRRLRCHRTRLAISGS
ncbi:hypothetical protein FBZ93_116184 [Bradyrhizobium macuxiense]|uniref:Uncharacterized protein n=1 Tax=Bradyrhizobium macuxiense TaxID=1755647 RepID=A0A560L230_9BRAD|nr:hypothetical protein FBZ93_116184 [Bradyrhizobium macuxiense]